jgi:ribonucleoside-diphosphate reductase alpha chain
MEFRTKLGADVFRQKYAMNAYESWEDRANQVVNWVCGDMDGHKNPLMSKDDRDQLVQYISDFKFMPGGRYLWYAGRQARFFNNCYLLRLEEDSREEWAALTQRAMSCLMTGGGIGVDVSICRPSGRQLSKTGGVASGPIPLLNTLNEVGRNVMQGGSRRSALYGSMNWQHEDARDFLTAKNWFNMKLGKQQEYSVSDMKGLDFNYPAPLDMMNISLNYDDAWLHGDGNDDIFIQNVRQAMMTGEPGFSFNFGDKQNETLRNACTEITSEDDSDVCNLGSVNLAAIESIEDFKDVVHLASKFLVCGLIRAHLPYKKVEEVRQRNSRLGLGLMGIHEWLLKRGYRYEMNDEYKKWLTIYERESERAANEHCDRLFLKRPKGYRAIAPTGTISILAGTTSGIEPIYAVAYRRRYLTDGTRWKHQFVVDGTAEYLIANGVDPEKIESAVDLAIDPERRIKMQYDHQKHIDHGISSTHNFPEWGSEYNNEDLVPKTVALIKKYAHGMRGFTIYPSGSRFAQPVTAVPYEEARAKRGVIYEDNSDEQCLSGVCNL